MCRTLGGKLFPATMEHPDVRTQRTVFPDPVAQLHGPLMDFHALVESHFVPFFQPIVTLRTGQLSGFEVLARGQHPRDGIIPPSRFIAIAERDGWIGDLTRHILQQAFLAAAAIPDPLTLAINISPLQLRDPSLPEQICRLAAQAHFPLKRLIVEITESALIENPQGAASIVSELRSMGCRLALDDFGTGYSSLSHLQALPFDKLKIDRSFVSSMTQKRESRKIVSAVVGLGQSLGLNTVAEGIETQEQAEMLLWLGCDLGQGYFYGHPLPARDLPACISATREKLLVSPGSAWKKLSAVSFDSSPTQRLAQLQAVYDGAPVGLAFIDRKLCYVNLNQRLADMNGPGIEDYIGRPVAEMVPDLFPLVEPYLRRALGGEAIRDVEAKVPFTGQTRLVSYHPVNDEAGEVIGVSISVIDITERKRADEALKRSEANYKSIVELNPQVLWVMDPNGCNLQISPHWQRRPGSISRRSAEHEWLRSVHPLDIHPTVLSIAQSRREGAGIDVQYRVSDGHGDWLWKRSRGAPRFDAAGNIVCWYGSVEDVGKFGQTGQAKRHIPPSPPALVKPLRFENHQENLTEEELRSRALHALDILDTPAEAEFDDLVNLASEICGVPISILSFLDTERQWFKAAVGLSISETPLEPSFCKYTIQQGGVFIVEDASKDERFMHNPFVTDDPHIRFYAGMPLHAANGIRIGALCVIDTVPRTLSPSNIRALSILSHQIETSMELRSERRKNLKELDENQEPTAQQGASAFQVSSGPVQPSRACA